MNRNRKMKKENEKIFISLAFITLFLGLLGSLFIVAVSPRTETVSYDSSTIETQGTINSIIQYFLKRGSSNFITGANIGLLTAGDDTGTANGWNKTFHSSSTGNDEARTITADPSGNIFVGGYGNNLVGGSTSQDMWIKKFATDGTENLTHWNLSFDKTNSDMIWDIVSDINGQIYIAGEGNNLFNASTNFDWWIKKIQVNGTEDLTWNKTVFSPSSGTDEPKAITIDSNNNIFVVGYGNNLVNGNSQQDWWIKKYNSSGSENGTNWNLSFDKGSQDAAEDIVIDSSGNIFVAGEGTNLVSPTSGQDWWIKKFLANGTEDSTWNKSFGTQNTELIYGIKIDNSGNLYMVGSSNNLVNTSSANDWLLKKYNSSGSEDTTNWNKSFEGRGKSANDEAYDLVIDSNNNVYVVGYAGSLTNSSSSNDWWIKKYNSSGSEDTTNWNLSFDGKNNNGDIAYKALINSSNLYIAGSGNNLNSSTSVNDWWIKQINTTTDPTDCGTITSSLTLTGNKTATGNCYIIGSNNIIIDGSGFSITSNGSGMGVNNTAGYSNVTIKNLIINNFSTGIYLNNSVNHTIWNNTIQSVNASDSPGIKLISVNNSNLSFNNITIIGINTNAIYFGSSNNNLIYKNNILTLMSGSTVFSSNTSSYNNITSNNITFYSAVTGIDVNENAVSYLISSNTILYQGTGTGVGIDMDAINDSTIINNNITANTGVRITASAPMYSNNNTIESNSIVTVGSSDYGISLGQFGYSWWDVNNTLILNNNITATHYLIYDNSSDSQIQKLVYNNSFGEIRWIDNGSGSFLRGLDLNMTQRGVFGLGSQIFIDNNTVALNTSVFKMGVNKINSSANITVYTLNNWSSINQISFLSNYTTNSSEIRQKGTNCTNCFITSFSSGTLLFNVTSFSSYAGDSIGGVDSTNPSVFSLLPANNEIVNPVQTIEISANVTDDIGVQLVSANITSPNGTIINLTLSNGTGFSTKFNNSYTISNLLGTYTISFFANDTSNNINSTETTNFMVYSVDSETSDLTQWLMFGRYLNHTRWDGVSFPTISGLSNTSFTTGGDIYSASPVVVNGYVYVGSSDNTFYQLNASNISQKISNFTTGGTIYPSSAVVNGYVYVGSNDNKVYQLSASDVSQRIANFTTNSWIKSSPAVANGYLYVGSLDFQIYQLNASNIAQKISNFTTLDSIESSPAVSNGYVYVGSWDNTIYQLNATNISQQISSYTTNDDVYSSPAVANGYVYVGSDDNNVYQLNASNISQQIANFTGAGNIIRSSPAIANGYVYVGSYDNKIYQLNASNISQHIANFTTGYYVPSSPTIANGYVYVGSYDNKVYQLNASNISQHIANFTTGDDVQSSPAVANGYVYVGSADNKIYQLNASNIASGVISGDTAPPSVSGVLPIQNTTFNVSQTVIIAANVTDDVNVSRVFANVSEPNGTIKNIELTYRSADLYNTTFTAPALIGSYNVTFIANDSSNNINSTVTTNFTVLDVVNPSVSGVLPIQNTTFNVSQTVIIAANVTDDVNVSRVFANVSEPNGTIKVVELTYRSANLYNTTFTAPNLTGGYNITFIANDSSNNINSTVITNFTVLDVINPSVSGVLPIQNTTFNVSQTVIIAANVTDDVNVSRVFANVSEPNGTIKIVELLFDSGNRYNTTFTAPNLTGGYNVTFIANDSSNNQNRTITTNFSVLDVTNPLVSGVLPIQNSTFNISQTVIVAANVTDDVNVSRVFANISEPNGTIKVVELVFDSINRYNTTFTAPNLTGGYNVTFIANDSSNNINSTVTTNFTLLDAVNPSVSGVLPIQNSTFNVSQTVIIAANVTDNYNVSRVFANISEPNGTIKVVELTYRSADLYNTTFTAPNLTGGYNVTFITNDSSNNINTTVTTNFTILDIINPSVSGVLPIQNSTFNVSQTVIIAANVTDDVNVSRVFANISEPNGTIKVVELTYRSVDRYNTTFTAPTLLGRYNITFIVNDSTNNINTTITTNFTVLDVVNPSVSGVLPIQNNTFNVSQTVIIAANVTDDVNVSRVFANISEPNGTIKVVELTYRSVDRYNTTFTAPNLTGAYNITFIANDSSNNINTTLTTNFTVLDVVNPSVSGVLPIQNTSFIVNQTVIIAANVTDDVNISRVFANVSEPNGTIKVVELTYKSANLYNTTFTAPNLTGTYNVTFIANDSSNNLNRTINTNFSVVNESSSSSSNGTSTEAGTSGGGTSGAGGNCAQGYTMVDGSCVKNKLPTLPTPPEEVHVTTPIIEEPVVEIETPPANRTAPRALVGMAFFSGTGILFSEYGLYLILLVIFTILLILIYGNREKIAAFFSKKEKQQPTILSSKITTIAPVKKEFEIFNRLKLFMQTLFKLRWYLVASVIIPIIIIATYLYWSTLVKAQKYLFELISKYSTYLLIVILILVSVSLIYVIASWIIEGLKKRPVKPKDILKTTTPIQKPIFTKPIVEGIHLENEFDKIDRKIQELTSYGRRVIEEKPRENILLPLKQRIAGGAEKQKAKIAIPIKKMEIKVKAKQRSKESWDDEFEKVNQKLKTIEETGRERNVLSGMGNKNLMVKKGIKEIMLDRELEELNRDLQGYKKDRPTKTIIAENKKSEFEDELQKIEDKLQHLEKHPLQNKAEKQKISETLNKQLNKIPPIRKDINHIKLDQELDKLKLEVSGLNKNKPILNKPINKENKEELEEELRKVEDKLQHMEEPRSKFKIITSSPRLRMLGNAKPSAITKSYGKKKKIKK